MAAFNLNSEPLPKCYGISWNPKDVLCAGGADFTYKDERGSHVRPQCDFYASCGARVAHTRMEQTRLLPPENLVRSPNGQPAPATQAPAVTTPAASPPPNWMTPAQMQQYMNDQAKQMATAMFQQMQQQMGRPQASSSTTASYPQGGMYYDPRFQPMPVNYQMPGYLTVPEQPEAGGSIWGVLFRSLFRSMMKAGGHSFSHFWDTMPMGRPPGAGQ